MNCCARLEARCGVDEGEHLINADAMQTMHGLRQVETLVWN